MKPLLLLAAATLCFAMTESRVSGSTINAIERVIEQRLATPSADPYDIMEHARGTYLDGYGVLFTMNLDLINAGVLNMTPFKPTVSKEEVASTRERKLKKLATLRETMRALMMNASTTLEGLPPNEKIAMEAILFNYSWEDTRGIPHRVFMTADKQKLVDAKTAHADQTSLAAIVEEQER